MEILSQNVGANSPQYLIRDGHSSVRQIANPSGVITGNYHFDAYGQLLTRSDTPVTNILYVGQMWDSPLGFYDNWHRWYDPQTGRFNQMDDFFGNNEDPISLHKYLYCHANPINGTDSTGEFDISDITVAEMIQATLFTMNFCGAVYNAKQTVVSVQGLINEWSMGDFWGGMPHIIIGALHGSFTILNMIGMKASLEPPSGGGFVPALAGGGVAGETVFWSQVVAHPALAGWVVKTVAPAAMSAYIAFFESRIGGGSQSHHGVPLDSETYNYSDHPLVKKAGWTEEDLRKDPANIMEIGNHAGRHSKAYHEAIKRMLDEANSELSGGGREAADRALRRVLDNIREGISNGTLKPYKNKDVWIEPGE